MDKLYKPNHKHIFMKPKRWTIDETKALLSALALRKNFEAPTAQIYYTQLLKDTGIKTSWNILYRKVRNLKSSFCEAEEWTTSEEAKALKVKGDEDIGYYNLQLRNRCRYYYKLKDIFGGKGLTFHKNHTSKDSQKDSDLERMHSSEPLSYNSLDRYSIPSRQVEGNSKIQFSDISALLSKRGSFQNEPEMIEHEFETRKFEKETEFRSRKQRMEFEIQKQELEIRRMEIEKNEYLKILDIRKDEIMCRYNLELKYNTDIKS